jgi:hypothetical protein
MAAQSTTDVVGLQLEQVRDKLPELFHYNDVFVNRIDTRKDVIKVSSRATRIPLQIRPGSKYGLVNLAGGALGRGTSTHYDAATLTPIASRIAIEINQDALDQTSGDPKSIRKLLSIEIRNAMREFRVQLNAQVQLAGDNVLATVSATAAGQITVKNAPFFSQLLRAGQVITVYDSTITTNRGTATIQSIDFPNQILNVDAVPGGTTSGDVLLPEGVSGAQPVGYFGIRYHHSDSAVGTWMNLSRVTNPEVRSNAVHNGQNALTTAPIRLLLTKIIQRVGSVNPKNLAAHLHMAQAAAYEELAILVTEIHKGSGNENFDMLFGTGQLAGVKSMPDLHAARDRIDFVNFDTWGKVESAPVDFLKTPDGRYFDRPVDSATGSQVASVIFWIYWFGQFFVDNPAAVGFVDQLAIPLNYDTL